MFTHLSLNLHLMWEEVDFTATAIWQPDGEGERLILEKSGRVPVPADATAEECFLAVARHLHQFAPRRDWQPR